MELFRMLIITLFLLTTQALSIRKSPQTSLLDFALKQNQAENSFLQVAQDPFDTLLEPLEGLANDIAVGADGDMWHIGQDGDSDGYEIFRWNKETEEWDKVSGFATRIAVGAYGDAWIVTKKGDIYRYVDEDWKQIEGTAVDIGAYGDTIWYAGEDNLVWRLTADGKNRISVEGEATRISVDSKGIPWIINKNKQISRWDGNAWERLPGRAIDIGCGPDGIVFIASTEKTEGGHQVMKWNEASREWISAPDVAANQVAVGSDGTLYLVQETGEMFKLNNPDKPVYVDFYQITGAAEDIGVGADGTVWIIGRDSTEGGYTVYRWDPEENNWQKMTGAGGVRLAVEPFGNAWIVTQQGELYRHSGLTWKKIAASGAIDIGVGSDNSVWFIGSKNKIFRLNKDRESWDQIKSPNGEARRISVDGAGNAWVTNEDQSIERWTSTKWETVSGKAIDIGCGSDGTVYITGGQKTHGGYQISIWNEDKKDWAKVSGFTGTNLAVGTKGILYYTQDNHQIFRLKNPDVAIVAHIQQIPGTAEDIAAGPHGSLYKLGRDEQSEGYGIYKWNMESLYWDKIPRSGLRVAVDADGHGWVVNSKGVIKYHTWNAWEDMEDVDAVDIGAGGGSVWYAGTDGIFKLNDDKETWTKESGKALRISVDYKGNPWIVSQNKTICRMKEEDWECTDRSGRDVGCGEDGSIYAIMDEKVAGGYQVSKFNEETGGFAMLPGVGAIQISVDTQGMVYFIQENYQTFRLNDLDIQVLWKTIEGDAEDIGVGADGSLWIVGRDEETDGFGIHRYNRDDKSWEKIEGAGVRISVDPKGNPWIVNRKNEIFRYTGEGWKKVPGKAYDIAVGSGNDVCIIGEEEKIYRLKEDGKTWELIPGNTGKRIAVDNKGNPWVADYEQNLWRYLNGDWILLPPEGSDIAAGADGTVVMAGAQEGKEGSQVYRWDYGIDNWDQVPHGVARQVAVGPNGEVYIVNKSNKIFYLPKFW